MWQPDEAYLHGLEYFGTIVDGVGDGDWDLPTPCAGWTVRDVVGHVGVTAQFGAELLAGRQPTWTPDPSPGAAVQGHPVTWWRDVETAVRQAMKHADLSTVVDSPRGRLTLAEGLRFPAVDLFVHGWDIAAAMSREVTIPHDAIEFAHRVIDPLPDDQIRSPNVFAEPVPVGGGASASDAFIAWTGRDPADARSGHW